MARIVAVTQEEGKDWARALLAAAGPERKAEVRTEFERGAFVAFEVPDDIYEAAMDGPADSPRPKKVPTAEQLAAVEAGGDAKPAGAQDLKAAAREAAKKAAAAKKTADKPTEPAVPGDAGSETPPAGAADGGADGGDGTGGDA